MKCIKLTSSKRIIRCEEKYADILIRKGIGVYSNKKQWKVDGRNYLAERDKYVLSKNKEI